MITEMEHAALIALKLNGLSNEKVGQQLGLSRETVRKRWKQYLANHQELIDAPQGSEAFEKAKEKIVEPPRYDSSNRQKRKYTEEIDRALDEILESEKEKSKTLTTRKQQLTAVQIHMLLVDQGFDIGITTITNKVREKRNQYKEAYVRQQYEYGERFEYDFGEAEVVIAGVRQKVQMAVITARASGYRFARLYRNQKMEVFLDSHAQFFEEAQGVFKEGVYDNMRNVVSKFTGRGRTAKELNPELLKLAAFYGFKVNTTNARSGNEKGSVEEAVKTIRQQTFALRWKFDSFEEMEAWFSERLQKLNAGKPFEEEKKHLLPYPGKYETAKISTNKVDSYSFVCVDSNFYSVPDVLVGQMVTVRLYPNDLLIFSKGNLVASHRRLPGKKKVRADIHHYLHTLTRKPGALKNSTALKSDPDLEEFFTTHFNENPRDFINFLHRYPQASVEELRKHYQQEHRALDRMPTEVTKNNDANVETLQNLFIGGSR